MREIYLESQAKPVAERILESWGALELPVPLFPFGTRADIPEINAYDVVFGGKSWTDISETTCANNRAALSFFTSRGLAYYIPAFLVASLRNWDVLVDVLETLSSEYTRLELISRFYEFSHEEMCLLREYLSMIAHRCHDDSDLRTLLESAEFTIGRIEPAN